MEDITVTDCISRHGHGMSIGGETAGGVVENISYNDITMKNVNTAITLTGYYMYSSARDPTQLTAPKDTGPQPVTDTTPIYRNIRFSNVTATCGKSAGFILGLPESQISNVALENVSITAATTGL